MIDLREELIVKFPMRKEHANILIAAYGENAVDVAYNLYKEGFLFTDLDKMSLDVALSINKKFKNIVDSVLLERG